MWPISRYYHGISRERLSKTLIVTIGASVSTLTEYDAILYLLLTLFNDAVSVSEVTKHQIRNGRMIMNEVDVVVYFNRNFTPQEEGLRKEGKHLTVATKFIFSSHSNLL
jgi:hypothetical protein